MEQIVKRLVAQNAMLASRVSALEGLVSRGIEVDPVADPAPDGDGGGWGGGGWGGGLGGWRRSRGWQSILDIPIYWDPAPEELFKLSKIQLQSRIDDIANMRRKLDSLEGLLTEAMERQG